MANTKKKFSQAVNNIGKRKMDVLHAACAIKDLKVPSSSHLEQLQGDLKGFYSIRINNQFRLIFKFEDANAYDVYIDDYHR